MPLTATASQLICARSDAFGAVALDATAHDSNAAVRIEDMAFKATPHRELRMTIYFPSDWRKLDRRPAIVFFFGGGWRTGNPIQFAHQSEYLAHRGMVAACADYRVKGKDNVGPKTCVEDAKSAVRWLRANSDRLGIDPERIVAGGGSAGGHLAACTALTPDIVGEQEDFSISSKTCALVLFNPVLNFVGIPTLMERIDYDEELARLISPTLHLQSGSPPAILFYGALDRLLPQGEAFAKQSTALGNRAELYITADQNHGFFNKAPFQDETLRRADRFLASLGLLPDQTPETDSR
jgi:acetyl esterase/lipase